MQTIDVAGWKITIPSDWKRSSQARGRPVDKIYYESADGQLGIYPEARSANAIESAIRSVPMSLKLSGQDLQGQIDDVESGIRRTIIDAVDAASKARVRHAALVRDEDGLRLTIHDYRGDGDVDLFAAICANIVAPMSGNPEDAVASSSAKAAPATENPSVEDLITECSKCGHSQLSHRVTCSDCGEPLLDVVEVPADHNGKRVSLTPDWSWELPPDWGRTPAPKSSVDERLYYASSDGQYGLYPTAMRSSDVAHHQSQIEGVAMLMLGMKSAGRQTRQIGSYRVTILDAIDRSSSPPYRVWYCYIADGSRALRLGLHDYEWGLDAGSIPIFEQILGSVVGSGSGEGVPSHKRQHSDAASSVVHPEAEAHEGDPEEMRNYVIQLITLSLLQQKGIGAGLMATLVQEAGTYEGLHNLLSGGIPAIKRCQGIGQKKAEVIDAVYRSLGGRSALERSAREHIIRRQRQQLFNGALLIIAVLVLLYWYAST